MLRRDGCAHCPDLVLNSVYWADDDEVAGFEELAGSHGGMGGGQGHSFVLRPSVLAYPDDEVVGPDAMHQVLRGWPAWLGHDAFAPDQSAQGADDRVVGVRGQAVDRSTPDGERRWGMPSGGTGPPSRVSVAA